MKPVRVLVLIFCMFAVTLQAQQKSYPIETINGKEYYRYTVEKGIGLYRLSVNFGVSQEEILEANPKLMKTGLQYGETVLIPVAQSSQTSTPVRELSQEIDSTPKQDVVVNKTETPVAPTMPEAFGVPQYVSPQENEERERFSLSSLLTNSLLDIIDHPLLEGLNLDSIFGRDTLKIAFMLPLQAQATKRTPAMERFVDYYMGALIAIYEEQLSGKNIQVFTYDIGKNVQAIQSILESDSWQHMDAIIGPAYSQQIDMMLEYAKEDSTWVLVPFSADINDAYGNPNVLQYNASNQTQAEAFAQYLEEYKDDINCVLVQNKAGDAIPKSVQAVHEALQRHEIPSTKITIRSILHDSLARALVPGKENIIIFNTEKISNLSVVMPYLQKCLSRYRLTLYSRYSWQQETIDIPQIYTSIFLENIDPPYNYKGVYQRFFSSEPSSRYPRYDLLGYDQVKQLLSILQDPSFIKVEEIWLGIQSNVSFQPSIVHSGYENLQVNVVRK